MILDPIVILRKDISVYSVKNENTTECFIKFRDKYQIIKGENLVKYFIPILNKLETPSRLSELFSIVKIESHDSSINILQLTQVLDKLIELKIIEVVPESESLGNLENHHIGDLFYVKGHYNGVSKKKIIVVYDCDVSLAKYIIDEITKHEMIECVITEFDNYTGELTNDYDLILSIHRCLDFKKIRELNDLSRTTNQAWISVIFDTIGFRIGPTVKGLDLSCYECLEPNLVNDSTEKNYYYRKALNYCRTTVTIASGILCDEVNRILFNNMVTNNPTTYCHYLEYNAKKPELIVRRVVKQPNCKCSSWYG